MKKDGVEIRTSETEQRDLFDDLKHKEGREESNKVPELDSLALFNHNQLQMYDAFHYGQAVIRATAEFNRAFTKLNRGYEEEREESNKVPKLDNLAIFNYNPFQRDAAFHDVQAMGWAVELNPVFTDKCYEDEGEWFNKLYVKDKQRYICEVPKPYDEVGDGGGSFIGGTSVSSTRNMNYGRGGVRGPTDPNHIPKNHFASDDEGNYEGLTEIMHNEAAMKQNIDNKKVNYEHVIEMPKGPDLSNKKEQANDGQFGLCDIGLANTVSLMGSNPPPWAATVASQKLLGFSGAANVVGYVGTTAALSLRYTRPRAARIFANIGPISCAWGVIMGFTSYLPGEFQWLGYVAAVFCTLAVLLANF